MQFFDIFSTFLFLLQGNLKLNTSSPFIFNLNKFFVFLNLKFHEIELFFKNIDQITHTVVQKCISQRVLNGLVWKYVKNSFVFFQKFTHFRFFSSANSISSRANSGFWRNYFPNIQRNFIFIKDTLKRGFVSLLLKNCSLNQFSSIHQISIRLQVKTTPGAAFGIWILIQWNRISCE